MCIYEFHTARSSENEVGHCSFKTKLFLVADVMCYIYRERERVRVETVTSPKYNI